MFRDCAFSRMIRRPKPCLILHSTLGGSVKNVEKWQLTKSCGLPFHEKRPCEASCVCFARSLFFVVCMDTAFFKYSLLYHKIIMRFRYRPDFLGAPSYTGVCSIPVHRLDESIRISDNMISTDVPFADENRLSLQTDITGGRQWQRKRKNNRVGPAL